jgi:hypothetical protein
MADSSKNRDARRLSEVTKLKTPWNKFVSVVATVDVVVMVNGCYPFYDGKLVLLLGSSYN